MLLIECGILKDSFVFQNYIKKLLAARNSAVTMYFTGLTDIDHEGIWLYDTPWNPKPKDGLM